MRLGGLDLTARDPGLGHAAGAATGPSFPLRLAGDCGALNNGVREGVAGCPGSGMNEGAHILTRSPSASTEVSSRGGEKWPTTLHGAGARVRCAPPGDGRTARHTCAQQGQGGEGTTRIASRPAAAAAPSLRREVERGGKRHGTHLLTETHVGNATPFSMLLPLNTLLTALRQNPHCDPQLARAPTLHLRARDAPAGTKQQLALGRHQSGSLCGEMAAHSVMSASPRAQRSTTLAPAMASFTTVASASVTDPTGWRVRTARIVQGTGH